MASLLNQLANLGRNVGNFFQQNPSPVRFLQNQTQQPQTSTVPQVSPIQSQPLNSENIAGILNYGNANKEFGFTPTLMGINRNVQQFSTSPISGELPEGAGAANFGNKIVSTASYAASPNTLAHEALHSAFARKTPEAQQAFRKLLSSLPASDKPDILNMLNSWSGYYGDKPASDLNNIPTNLLNEAHSEIPNYYGSNLPSSLKNYYKAYFNNGALSPTTTQTARAVNYRLWGQKPQFSGGDE